MWKIYDGSPFEGERIFKFKSGVLNLLFEEIEGNTKELEAWQGAMYLDESPSYSIEDMREAFEVGYLNGFHAMDEWNCNAECLKWIKEREGK
jgi:hypothetical protein